MRPMMTNHSKPAGSIPTTWELRTYDTWGNPDDGYEVNDTYNSGEVTLRIPQTRYNVGIKWYVCRNPECPGNNPCGHNPPCAFGTHRRDKHGVIPYTTHNSETGDMRQRCPECHENVVEESQEFLAAYPTNRQIKQTFGVNCRISTDGDDMVVYVTRERDGYPIGEMHCVSHLSLSPVRKIEGTEVKLCTR